MDTSYTYVNPGAGKKFRSRAAFTLRGGLSAEVGGPRRGRKTVLSRHVPSR